MPKKASRRSHAGSLPRKSTTPESILLDQLDKNRSEGRGAAESEIDGYLHLVRLQSIKAWGAGPSSYRLYGCITRLINRMTSQRQHFKYDCTENDEYRVCFAQHRSLR